MLVHVGTNLPQHTSTGPSYNHTHKERMEEEPLVADTDAATNYKEKKSQDDRMDDHKHFQTIDDNYYDTYCRPDLNIGAQCAKNC